MFTFIMQQTQSSNWFAEKLWPIKKVNIKVKCKGYEPRYCFCHLTDASRQAANDTHKIKIKNKKEKCREKTILEIYSNIVIDQQELKLKNVRI